MKNKLKTLTQGTKSDVVLGMMANTFTAQCRYADFASPLSTSEIVRVSNENRVEEENSSQETQQNKLTHELINKTITTEMPFNIQIHLPETKRVLFTMQSPKVKGESTVEIEKFKSEDSQNGKILSTPLKVLDKK